MAHYYGFGPDIVDLMTMTQVNGYIDEIPMLEYRNSWPMAVMIAQFGNFQGGRSKRKPKKASDSIPYKPEDFFPYMWFAQYEPYLDLSSKDGLSDVSEATLQELWDTRFDLPNQFLSLIVWDDVRKRLGIED